MVRVTVYKIRLVPVVTVRAMISDKFGKLGARLPPDGPFKNNLFHSASFGINVHCLYRTV